MSVLQPSDLPLLLSSSETAGERESYPLDRIRMQKAIFLLTQRGAEDWRDLYAYRPYNWGPYSSALTSDLGRMVAIDQIRVEDFPGSRYGHYVATAAGEHRARQAWQQLDLREQAFIKRTREYVTSRSFQSLLREVYSAYPEFATESRFTG